MSSVTDITTKEKSWSGWTDGDWCINLGRTHVDGEKMKTDPWNTTQNRPHILASWELLDVNMSKTTFLCYLCTMRERGRKKKIRLLTGRRNTTVDKLILLLWSTSCMGSQRTQFSVNYDAVCGCDWCLPLLWSSFPLARRMGLWPSCFLPREGGEIGGH